jgi:hypothetical protein
MPPRRDDNTELSAEDIELAGRLLMPAFRECVRSEIQQPLTEIRGRLDAVEGTSKKAMKVYGGLVFVVTLLWMVAGEWLKKKVGL